VADGVFNCALGKAGYYATLPAANDSLIVVLLQATGLEADGTLRDHDDLAALLAASNDEATFTGYTRKTLASVTATVDDTNNRLDADAGDFTYTAAGGATNNSIGKAIICYKPDTASVDSAIIPLTFHDCTFSTDGTDQLISLAATGFYRAA
jgi:hypothetical protein